MSRVKFALLAGTLATGLGAAGIGGAAFAQPSPTYDPAQLPTIKGKVAQYTLTPRGDVDGFILDDGTEVNLSPRLSTQLVFAVKPGDAVTIHGLRAKALPLVAAMSVTNDATNATIMSSGERREHGPGAAQATTEATGTVKAQLHGPHGEMNGVLLADGTNVRLPPPEATKLGDKLAVGKSVYVRGIGISNPLGKLVMARAIGTSKADATEIAMPHGGPGGWMHGMMRGMHHDGGPMGGERMGGSKGDAPR